MNRRHLVEVVLGTLAVFVAFNTVAVAARVQGPSMLPTLRDGDTLIVTKLGDPHRGEIVVFNPGGGGPDFVKRVAGVPGDVVRIAAARLYVNDSPVREDYLPEAWTYLSTWRDGQPQPVPDGEYFLLGDNRNHSNDSRVLGFQPRSRIVGVVRIRVWPPDGLGPVASVLFPG